MEHILAVITKRELQEILFAMHYSEFYNHGTDGHNRLNLVTKLATALGFVRGTMGEIEVPPGIKVDDGPTTGHGKGGAG